MENSLIEQIIELSQIKKRLDIIHIYQYFDLQYQTIHDNIHKTLFDEGCKVVTAACLWDGPY